MCNVSMADERLTILNTFCIKYGSIFYQSWLNNFLMWLNGGCADRATIFIYLLVGNLWFVTEVYARASINVKPVRCVN